MASPQEAPDVASRVTSLLQGGEWTSLGHLMHSGQLTDRQKVKVIVDMTTAADVQQFSEHVLPVCGRAEIDRAAEELISAGRWQDVLKLSLYAGRGHSAWQIGNLSVSSHVLTIVAKGRWGELGPVLLDLPPDLKQWALLQASRRATQLETIQNVLPHCGNEDLDSVLKELVWRGSWWAVGSLFRQRREISKAQKTWAVEQAANEATTWELTDFILPHCTEDILVSVSRQLITRKLWWALSILLKKDVYTFSECVLPACGDADYDQFMSHLVSVGRWDSAKNLLWIVGIRKHQWQIGDARIFGRHIRMAAKEQWSELFLEAHKKCGTPVLAWVMEEMSKRAEQNLITAIVVNDCPLSQMSSVMKNLLKRGFMEDAARIMCRLVGESLENWAEVSGGQGQDETLCNLVTNHTFDLKEGADLLRKALKEKVLFGLARLLSNLAFQIITAASPKQLLCKVLFDSALRIVLRGCVDKEVVCTSTDDQVQLAMTKILRETSVDRAILPEIIPRLCEEFNAMLTDNSSSNPIFALSLLRGVMKHCYRQGHWSFDTGAILNILTTVPVVPNIQKDALRVMLEVKNWDVICLADLTYVGEQVRRLLFSFAVKQKRWSLVRQWADHALNDDQRTWALKQALKEKQWEVSLRLAEHGLTEDELIRVHFHLAMHADWKVVLDLYKHQSDIVEVRRLLQRELPAEKEREWRVSGAESIETDITSRMVSLKTLETAVKEGDWQVVVFTLRHTPSAHKVSVALGAAVASEAWTVVMQLIRLGILTADHHPLFLDMIRNRQWGVCAVMIEQDLNMEQYADVIPQLMELNQWTLVGKMMKHGVEDSVRRQVMQRALQRSEGSVVCRCIEGMKQQLSLQEREDLFHWAVISDNLQAVIPLVSEKDDTGTRHRDVALLTAVSQHQWDVVDHCLQHHADLNTRDDQGALLIHRSANLDDWDTVLALAKRGADPSLLDKKGKSVLHLAIKAGQWEHVKSLITLCGDLQQSVSDEEESRTTLEMLIEARQDDIIAHALSRNIDQWNGVNRRGETALHTLCISGWHENICPQLLEGAKPLSVTHRGHSALSYAVLSKWHPRKVVAKCISMGLSTHQPQLTHAMQQTRESFLSPILLAVMSGLTMTTQMLYESGACSHRELFHLLPNVLHLTDPSTARTCSLMNCFLTETRIVKPERSRRHQLRVLYESDFISRPCLSQPWVSLVEKAAQYLIEVSATPRTLKSMCRLVIAHSLKVSDSRDRDVSHLPVANVMKEYILFSDLVHPEYGHDEQGAGTVTEEGGFDRYIVDVGDEWGSNVDDDDWVSDEYDDWGSDEYDDWGSDEYDDWGSDEEYEWETD